MTTYLGQLLETLETIPTTVTTSLSQLRQLDEESKKYYEDMIEEGNELNNQINDPSVNCDNYKDLLAKYEEYQKKKDLLKDMMTKQQQLANELYNALDTAIIKYDEENEKLKTLLPHSKSKEKRKDQGSNNNSKKRKNEAHDANEIDSKLGFLINPDTVEAYADPSEPRYCHCKRISFGQMIGCENEDCPIEWFHFECVGLHPSLPAPEVWYCSDKCKLEAEKKR